MSKASYKAGDEDRSYGGQKNRQNSEAVSSSILTSDQKPIMNKTNMTNYSAKSQISLLQTNEVRKRRAEMERDKRRKSLLIYGTEDMKKKMYLFAQRQDRQKNAEVDSSDDEKDKSNIANNARQKKSCKERMKLSSRNQFLNFWDGFMLVVITYSCFTSMYFAAISFNICDDTIFWVENMITVFFIVDIILKFIRLRDENEDPQKVTHVQIAIRYLKGNLVPDILATVPLYLITRFKYDPCFIPPADGANFSVVLKLVRLMRIKRIFTLFDAKRVNKLAELLFSGQPRNKKVVYSLIMKNVYSVFRLILLTIIITYFIGCFFFLWSNLFKSDPNFIDSYGLNESADY